jgi:hypothetical protein
MEDDPAERTAQSASSSTHGEIISLARQRIINRIIPRQSSEALDGSNLNLTIAAVRALVATNDEIFHRIMGSFSHDCISGSVFKRYGYERVNVKQVQTKTQFTTYAEYSSMTFDLSPLKRLPAALCILQPIYKKKVLSCFIDYELSVERALGTLHDGVLLPYLAQLKHHLESIQVCLGDVDSWLLDAETNLRFIETTFETKLESGCDSVVLKGLSPNDFFVTGNDRCLADQPCVHCGSPIQMHQCVLLAGYYFRRCINLSSHGVNYYSYPKEEILMECAFVGKFEVVFHISHVTEQLRLLQFIEFMSN